MQVSVEAAPVLMCAVLLKLKELAGGWGARATAPTDPHPPLLQLCQCPEKGWRSGGSRAAWPTLACRFEPVKEKMICDTC